MTVPVIQELTIDARGATVGAKVFEDAMAKATVGADRAKASALGLTVPLTKAAEGGGRLGDSFNRLQASIDPVFRAQMQLERQLGVVDAAFRRGIITEQQVEAVRERLIARQVQGLQSVRDAAVRTADAYDMEAAASLRAANSNRSGAHSFNTANVAAQFQDIGVTAMMGQSPLTIALQQGTQLSAVLGAQGLTGVVRTLAGAFMSILNPVSLITIGVVAATAAGIQWFAGMKNGAEQSADALEKHKVWLDKILAGYKEASHAAGEAREAALALPKEAVVSNLEADLRAQETARLELQQRIDSTKADLAYVADLYAGLDRPGAEDDTMGTIAAQLDALRQLSLSAASSREEFDAAAVSAAKLMNEADDPTVKALAGDVVALVNVLRQASGEISATTAALAAMQQQAAKGFDIGDSLEAIKSLTPDLRTAKEQVTDLFNEGASAARTTGQLHNLADAAQAAYDAIDQQDAQREVDKAARAGATAIDKLADAYDGVVDNAERRIAQAKMEAQALGLTETAAARLRVEFELINHAEQAGVVVDAKKREELTRLAGQIVETEAATQRLTKAREADTAQMKQTADALAATAVALLRPWKSLDDVVSNVMGNFAQIGQTNLRTAIGNLTTTGSLTPANDNTATWSEARAKVFGKSIGEGFGDFLKNNGDKIGAGLGGLGVGYQTQNPLMGAIGGAMSGAAAGPWGAVIGGIAGFIGGLIGMNEELEKAKKLLSENKGSIDAFIGVGFGKEIDEVTAAVLRYRAQAEEYIKLAEAAGDQALVKRLREAADAYRDTLKAQQQAERQDQRMETLEDRYAAIQEDAIARLRQQANAQQVVIDRTRDFIESTKEFNSGLLLDDRFSPLNPKGMMQEAEKQFEAILRRARLGDANAQSQLQGAASSYLEAAQGYYGSSSGYQDIFTSVRGDLSGVVGRAEAQLTAAQRQLKATNDGLKLMGGMNDGIKSLGNIMKRLAAIETEVGKQQGKDAVKLQKSIDKLEKALRLSSLKRAS